MKKKYIAYFVIGTLLLGAVTVLSTSFIGAQGDGECDCGCDSRRDGDCDCDVYGHCDGECDCDCDGEPKIVIGIEYAIVIVNPSMNAVLTVITGSQISLSISLPIRMCMPNIT